jgi:hypothetical protein
MELRGTQGTQAGTPAHPGVMKIGDADRLLSGVPIKYLNVTDPTGCAGVPACVLSRE